MKRIKQWVFETFALILVFSGMAFADVSVEVTPDTVMLPLNKTTTLRAHVIKDGKTIKTPVGKWVSTDESVATVSKGGVVKGVKTGTAVIRYCNLDDEEELFSAASMVQVYQPVKSLGVGEKRHDMSFGQEYTIMPTITPEDATFNNLVWTSSKEEVATVDNGLVTAVGPGNCIIKMSTTDGSNKTAAISIFVSSLYTETQSVVMDSIGDITIPISVYGDDWEDKVSIKQTGDSIQYSRKDGNHLLNLVIGARKPGKSKLIITDKRYKRNDQYNSLTIEVEVNESAVPDIYLLEIVGAKIKSVSSGYRATLTLKNNMPLSIAEYYITFQYLNRFGEQVFSVDKTDGHCQSYYYTRGVEIKPGKTIEVSITDDKVGLYSGITEIRVAVEHFRTEDGTYYYIPLDNQYWFSSESGYLEKPPVSARLETLTSEEMNRSSTISLGFEHGEVHEHTRQYYGAIHTGIYIYNIMQKSIADNCGLVNGDIIFAFDGVAWKDDPLGLERSLLKILNGESVTFSVERARQTIDLQINQ